MRLTTCIVLVAALGAAVLIGEELRGEERPVRERVEELMPRLQSEDDAVRQRAEDELFRMGEPGRLEIERLSRDHDTRRAVTALRLLQSDRWAPEGLRAGEQPLARHDGAADGGVSMDDVEAAIRRHFDELQQRLSRSFRDLPQRLPDVHFPDLGGPKPDANAQISVQGSVTRDDRTLTWKRAPDGKVTVTVKDGDADAQTYEADSVETFRTAHPDVANELDRTVPTWAGGGALRIWDGTGGWEGLQDLRLPDGIRRFLDDAQGAWNDDSPEQQARPDDPHAERILPPQQAPANGPMLGIEWAPLPPLLAHHLRIDAGVVVQRVLPDTTAARLGLEPMDVLLELAGRKVTTRDDILAALRDAGDARIGAVVIRAGERRTLETPE